MKGIPAMNDEGTRIMVEIDAAAAYLMRDGAYWGLGDPPWPNHAAGPIRIALSSAPLHVNGQAVFQLWVRPAYAEVWRDWCQAHGEILKTYPDQRERDHGAVLDRAARQFAEALKL